MSGEDDDWFERALQEDSEGREEAPDDDPAEDDDGSGTEDALTGADGAPSDSDADSGEGGATEPDADSGEGGATASSADSADPVSVDPDSAPADGEQLGADDEGLFDDDFAAAMEGATDSGSGPDPASPGGDDPFGDAMGDDFGMGGPAAGGEGDVGGFGMGGTGGQELSDEELDSDIDRVDLGIEGLDEMIQGGVPERSLLTVIGSAGTGKTTFGLQFVNHGLQNGERAVYISLEESRQRVLRSAEEKGWPFEEYVEEGKLAVVDMDPLEMANSLGSIRSELPRLVDEFGASRLVLDSVSLLEMMYEDRATRRNEVYAFARSLKASGITTLVTSEASQDTAYASRYGIVEYLTDGVFVLQYVRPSDFRETRLAVEIQKIRDANHSREMKPYEITDAGLNVYRQANIF